MAQHWLDWLSFGFLKSLKVLDGLGKRAKVNLGNMQKLKMLALIGPLFDELLDLEVSVVLKNAEHAVAAQINQL